MKVKRGRTWLEMGGLFTSIGVDAFQQRAFSLCRFYADARMGYAAKRRANHLADARGSCQASYRASYRADQRATYKAA